MTSETAKAPAGVQDAGGLGEHDALVGDKVITQLEMTTSTEPSGGVGCLLEIAMEQLDVSPRPPEVFSIRRLIVGRVAPVRVVCQRRRHANGWAGPKPPLRGTRALPQRHVARECPLGMSGHSDQQFHCEVHAGRAAVRIRPVGELDIATVPLVEDHLAGCAAAGFKQLTLDLRALSFLDATGLRLILLWNAKSRTDGFAYRLIAGAPPVQRLFALTDTREQLDFVEASPSARRFRLGTPRLLGSCTTGGRGARATAGLRRVRGRPRTRGAHR
jgi:anti-sigma B factor antagonist